MALTKVTGQVINTSTDVTVGVLTVTNNLSVGGTLTYEDVTNIDSVGLITARDGISITGGNVTLTGGGSFTGDGSGLTGVSGLGTALGSGILENIFYFDKTMSVSSNTTVNPPASASTAYTHFTEVKIEDGVELTIEDGDSLVIDVLGLDPT